MKMVHADAVEYRKPSTRHREPNIEFKHLLRGERGSPQNYELLFARSVGHYFAPRHRHNFDQIRLSLSGSMGDGKGDDLSPGAVGYYPEGVHYTLDCRESETLLLQFGGATGWGFTHFEQLYQAYPEVAKLGEFRDGVFFRNDRSNLPPGVKRNQDGYEALWQHIHGQPVQYPKPRFQEAVRMNPDNSAWLPDEGQNGVARRTLGLFTERLIEASQIRVAAGATLTEAATRAPRLLFVQSGHGTGTGGEWRLHTAVELAVGESVTVTADQDMVVFVMGLPIFAASEKALTERSPEAAAA